MRRAFAFLVLIVVAVVGYGFYDAYATEQVTPASVDLGVRPVSGFDIYFDSMDVSRRMNDGDVVLKITWKPPVGKRVSAVRISGRSDYDGKPFAEFSGLCQRGLKTNLLLNSTPRNSFSDEIDTDPVCFMDVPAEIPHRKGQDGRAVDPTERDRTRALARTVELEALTATVWVANTPMQYVTWIETNARKAWA